MRCAECHRPVPDGLAACPHDGAPALHSVAEALRSGPMALTQVVKVVDRALESLAGLHATGRAHGAIGPEAVLFRQKGDELRVVVWAPDEPPDEPYWAPERDASPAADVFAIGVLLHHMVTGRRPPPGGDLPSLEGLALQDVPEPLDRLIAALGAADPGRRPSSISAVQAELQNLELDSTLSGARLAAVRAAAGDAPARQVMLSAPYEDEVDPHEDTYVRGRGGIEAAVQQVRAEREADPFADTVIGSREQIEAEEAPDVQDTLLGLPPEPAPDAGSAAALAALDARTEMLPDSPLPPEPPGRWILLGVLAGLALGGVVAAVALL